MATDSDALIGGRYAVDTTRPVPGAGGGLPAFAALDCQGGRTDLIAVQAARHLPPRARALQALSEPIEGVLAPLAHGAAPGPKNEAGYFIICPAPPGPPTGAREHPWPESELLEQVLRPAARALVRLQQRGVTHRAIRPGNVFQPAPGRPVVLGAAWAAPPAAHQPAIAEPPYVAMCLPAGRGDGTIADDVYALGVLLLALALGQAPLADTDEMAVLTRKLEVGSYAALVGSERLPPAVADLLRGMLAEDPEHRPSPALLTEPAAARTRRVAARPPHRAQRPLQLGGQAVWNVRGLAHAVAIAPEAGLKAWRSGTIDVWLRRSLGDGGTAARLDEILHSGSRDDPNGEEVLAMRVVAGLDPLAPLCWRGVALWPDGLGAALAAADTPELTDRSSSLIQSEAISAWATARAARADPGMLRIEARQHRAWLTLRGPTGGLERLTYTLNPLLACASPLLAGTWVAHLADLAPALEQAAQKIDRNRLRPIDLHIRAFIAGRAERGMEGIVSALQTNGGPLSELMIFAQLATRYRIGPLPRLASWLAERPEELLATVRGKGRRERLAQHLKEVAGSGELAACLAVVQDPVERNADALEAQAAAAELAAINSELARLESAGEARSELAQRWGQELAAGVGLAAVAGALLAAVLG